MRRKIHTVVADTTMQNPGISLLELNHKMGQCLFGSFTGTVAFYMGHVSERK